MPVAVKFDSARIDRSPCRTFALGLYPQPEPARTARGNPGPDSTDSAWWLGFELGYDKFFTGPSVPDQRWPEADKRAFRDGYRDGLAQFDAEMTGEDPGPAPFDECRCGCGRPLGMTLDDYNELRIKPPDCAFLQAE